MRWNKTPSSRTYSASLALWSVHSVSPASRVLFVCPYTYEYKMFLVWSGPCRYDVWHSPSQQRGGGKYMQDAVGIQEGCAVGVVQIQNLGEQLARWRAARSPNRSASHARAMESPSGSRAPSVAVTPRWTVRLRAAR